MGRAGREYMVFGGHVTILPGYEFYIIFVNFITLTTEVEYQKILG